MTLLLILILIVTALPVLLWRRTRPLAIPVLALFTVYCFLVRDWLFGDLTYCHDTYQGYQFYFNITRQWVKTGTGFGWNPFLGAGQPMSVMSNLFIWLPAVLLAKAEMIFGISISSFKFSNLVYLSIMLFSATGMVLLLQLLFRNVWVTFFGATAFVWGGMFVYNLHQVWPMLMAYPLAFSLFFLIHSYKTGTWPGLVLFSVYIGSMANHYIPLYVYLMLLLVMIGLGFNLKRMKIWWRKLNPLRNWPKGVLCFLIFILSAGPFLYSYYEMQDFVSPSRGFTEHGTISSQNTGENIPVSAPLPSFMNLVNTQWIQWENNYWLTSAYLGAVPSILILSFLPVVIARDRILRGMAFVTIILVLLAVGYNTPVWGLLVDYVPFFNMFRHPSIFSSAVPFFAIILSAGCLNYFVRIKQYGWQEIAQLSCGVTLFAILSGIHFFENVTSEDALTKKLLVCVLLIIMVTVLAFFSEKNKSRSQSTHKASRFSALAMGVFVFVNLMELGLYTHDSIRLSPDYQKKYLFSRIPDLRITNILLRPVTGLCRVTDYELEPMKYPDKWVSRCISCFEDFSPFLITPMIQKRVVWSHMDPNFLFMLKKDFASEYRSRIMGLNETGKLLAGDLFNLAPDDSGWSVDRQGPSWFDSLREKSLNPVTVPGSKNLGTLQVLPSSDPNRISLKINANQDVYILRMENYHPGWKATVDGNPVPIQKAEPLFQILPVPKGSHVVEFRFESMYDLLVRISLSVTLIGWLGVSFWLYGGKIKRRQLARA